MELGHILWPSDPVTRESRDPVDPVTQFYNELQISTYVADKCLQWARVLPVFIAVCPLHASGKYNFEDHLLNVSISMTVARIFTKIYIIISLSWAFFRKPEKLSSHAGSKWWPGDPDVKDDPLTRWTNDPVPCLISTRSFSRETAAAWCGRGVHRLSPCTRVYTLNSCCVLSLFLLTAAQSVSASY